MPVTVELSIVVPVFNEEDSIPHFFQQVDPIVDKVVGSHEYIVVNDGSRDRTLSILQNMARERSDIVVINLSRNFGKDIALSAGIDYCRGQAVIPMDIDLQDPPALIEEMFAKYREGYDMVVAVRDSRDSDSWLKRTTANGFYALIGRMSDVHIPANAGDFRLMDRRVVDVLKRLPERSRFMKGLFAWLGFRSIDIRYERPLRAHGKSKWNYWKLWNFALDGIFSFSTAPLRVWSYIGIPIALVSFIYMGFIVVRTVVFGVDLPGYASLLSVMLFLGGLNLIGIGILGEYVGRLFLESKQRPLYIVDNVIGDSEDQPHVGR